MLIRSLLEGLLAVALSGVLVRPAAAQTPPAGFQDTLVTIGVANPSTMAFAPDGRLFVTEKATGLVRIIDANGTLIAKPLIDMNAVIPSGMFLDTWFERGLLGITFDPAFATNGYVYVYYTICKTPHPGGTPGTSTGCDLARNRVVRITAVGDVADPASQVILLDDIDAGSGQHNGGWLGIGPLDGDLYVAVGEAGMPAHAPDLSWLNGKILRIRTDGTIPQDNPFVGQAGARGEVWAYGLRNPYRCRFHPDGRLFCGDVGQSLVEELDVITRGANYGWPSTEGPFDPASHPTLTNPIYSYNHVTGVGAAIIAGDFGSRTNFQSDYPQSFFFADYVQGTISRAILDGTGVAVQSIASFEPDAGANSVTDMVAGPDGSLYYANYATSRIRKIQAVGNHQPVAVAGATPTQGGPPLTVQLSSAGTSDADGDPLTYLWDFGDGTATSTAANPSHLFTTAGPKTVTLTVSDGHAVPGPGTTTVTVLVGTPPVLTISQPAAGTTFHGGDVLTLAGSGVDAEDGPLPSSALHWRVRFHHNTHYHPYIDDIAGSPQSFQAATVGETDADVSYEITLSATDATGLPGSTTLSLLPVTALMSFATSPTGLQLTLDGQTVTTPLTVTGVAGVVRTIGAPSPQSSGAQSVTFSSWSDGGAQTHDIATPASDTTYTAGFTLPCGAVTDIPAAGGTFSGTTTGSSALSGSCSSTSASPEQVFRWTPSTSGAATIDTCGNATLFDTVVYLRTGVCGSGGEVSCNDDTNGCGTGEPSTSHGSRLTPVVTAGQTLFIVVDGYNGKAGPFALHVTPPAAATTTTTTSSTTTSSSSSTVTSTTSTSVTTSTAATSTTATSSTTSTSTSVTTTTSTSTTSSSTTSSTVPSSCDAVTLVPPEGGVIAVTTSGASTEQASCSQTDSAPERIYQWTPALSGQATIDTCSTSATTFDTVLYLRAADCHSTEIACNDDAPGCGIVGDGGSPRRGSRLTPTVTAGQTYFIVVDGYATGSGTAQLTITPPAAPTTTTTSVTSTSMTTTTTTSSTTSTTSTVASTTVTSSTLPSTTSTSSTTATSTTVPTTSLPTTTVTTTTSSTATSTTSSTASSTTSSTAVVTTTSTSSSTTTTTVPPCQGGCDDGDACTTDTCNGVLGCTHEQVPATDVGAVDCSVAGLRAAVANSSLCTTACPRALMKQIEATAQLVTKASNARSRGRCRQRLRDAFDLGRSLTARLGRLLGTGRIEPPSAAERLALEIARLRSRIAALPATYCVSH